MPTTDLSHRLAAGLLLTLDISIWTGTASLEPPDLGLDPARLAAHYTLGRKRLVPKQALEPIRQVANRARHFLECLSHALPDGGRFVLSHAVPEVLDRLDQERQTFTTAVDTFLQDYGSWKAAMASEWEAAAQGAWQTAGYPDEKDTFISAFLERVEAAYPARPALTRKFDFFYYAYDLRLSGIHEIDAQAAAEEERRRRQHDQAYQAQVEARIAEALDRSMAGFRVQVSEAFQAVLDHVRSGRPVRQGAVDRLQRSIERFRKLNIFGDDILDHQLAEFQSQCLDGLTPEEISHAQDLRAFFQRGLEEVIGAATAPTEVSTLTGRLRRQIDLDPDSTSGGPDAVGMDQASLEVGQTR